MKKLCLKEHFINCKIFKKRKTKKDKNIKKIHLKKPK